MTIEQQTSRLRKWVYSFLIVVAVGAAIGRILAVERVYEPSLYKDPTAEKDKRGDWPSERPPALPTFSSNDRSRWATVRCLVEHGTYVIGERDRSLLEPGAISLLAATNGLDAAALAATGYTLRVESTRCTWKESEWESGWDTVDKVLHPGTQKFYSSKPPLLSTLVAGLYWILHKITGWTFALNVWEIVKILLVVINVLPFAVYLFLLSRLVERFGQSDWSRLYIVTAAAFATLVTPFLITFNNHTFGTFSVVFALFPALTILTKTKEEGKPSFCHYLWAGFFASFAACVDLPAAAFAGL